MKTRILIVSQYYYPEQFRINDISSEWVKKGYDVTVVTGIPNYPEGKFFNGYGFSKKRNDNYNGVKVIRLPIIPRGKGSINLSLNYLSFVFSGFIWQLITKVKADYVFIFEVSPMTQALPGVWYAKKNKIPCYLYVQDLWPENVEIITGITNKKFIGLIGKMVDYIYARCDKIFTTSNSFIHSIKSRGVLEERLEYWPQYAEDFYKPIERVNVPEIPSDDVFNIIFAGNIGTAQGLDILVEVAKLIIKNNSIRIRFNIVGDGRYKSELVSLVKLNGLDELFNFIPKQPAIRIPEFLSSCDAAFLSLSDNQLFKMTIPAKLQSYMACGIPNIVSAGGETAQIVSEAKSGLCSEPGDVNQLAENIIRMSQMSQMELKVFGENAYKYYTNNFNKEALLNKMDGYFRG